MSKRTTLVFQGLLAATFVGFLLAAAPALSAEPEEPDEYDYTWRNGFYLNLAGVSGLAVFNDFEDPNDSIAGIHSFGFNGRFGYRLMKYVAVEGMFEWVDGWDLEDQGQITREISHVTSGWANVKGYFPIGRWHPYAELGVGAIRMRERTLSLNGQPMDRTVKGTDFGIRPGLGLDFHISEDIGLNVDASWVQPIGQWQDNPYVSINWGFFIRF